MVRWFGRSVRFGVLLLAALWFGSATEALRAEGLQLLPYPGNPGCGPCPSGPAPGAPYGTPPYLPGGPGGTTGGPGGTTGGPGGTTGGGMDTGGAGAVPGFVASAGAGAGAEAGIGPGYIDDAIPASRVRIRYDAMYDDNRPDRAEFFYPKCGCLNNPSLGINDGHGPPLPERSVDSQELSFYLEYAASERFSGFVEVPIRFINPEVNRDFTGLSDVNFGFKYALIYGPQAVLTAQVRAWARSGGPLSRPCCSRAIRRTACTSTANCATGPPSTAATSPATSSATASAPATSCGSVRGCASRPSSRWSAGAC